MEGVRLRPRRPQRRLRRPARPRGDDRPVARCSRGTWASGSRSPGRSRSPSSAGRRPSDWMLPKTSIKFVPAEYHSQSAIAAAFDAPGAGSATRRGSGRSRSPRSGRPSRSSARTPRSGGPKTRETADHSLPYCTAVALVDGEVSADQFTAERLADPALLDLVAADHRRRGPRPDRRLSRRHPEPGDGDARRRLDARRARSRSRPATTRTR